VRVLPPGEGRVMIVGSLTESNDDWAVLKYFAVVAEGVWMSDLNGHEVIHLPCPGQWTPALEYALCCCDL